MKIRAALGLTIATALLYAIACGVGDDRSGQMKKAEAHLSMMRAAAAQATAAEIPGGEWIVAPLDAAQLFTLAFGMIATNDSMSVRRVGSGFSVKFADGLRPMQAFVVDLTEYQFLDNLTHDLVWDRPDTNADGTPLVDFDGRYLVTIVADYEVWHTGADSASVSITLPYADRVTAVARAIDRNGNVSDPSNVLVIDQDR